MKHESPPIDECPKDMHYQKVETDIEPPFRALMGIFALHSFLHSQMDGEDVCADLSEFERNILVRLNEPRRLGQLARDTRTLPSTMTTVADQLERRSLVTRERDPQDRRAWLLVLTDEGRARRAELVDLSMHLFRDLFHLGDEEIQQFADTATKIHEHIQIALDQPDLVQKIRKMA